MQQLKWDYTIVGGGVAHWFSVELTDERAAINLEDDAYAWLANNGFSTQSLRLVRTTKTLAIRNRSRKAYTQAHRDLTYAVKLELYSGWEAVAFKMRFLEAN